MPVGHQQTGAVSEISVAIHLECAGIEVESQGQLFPFGELPGQPLVLLIPLTPPAKGPRLRQDIANRGLAIDSFTDTAALLSGRSRNYAKPNKILALMLIEFETFTRSAEVGRIVPRAPAHQSLGGFLSRLPHTAVGQFRWTGCSF
jgi:hypothetical protein